MPDWGAHVRERLRLGRIKAELQQDIIDDLAAQLDDAYRENLARGLSEVDAEAAALMHVADWQELAQQIATSHRLTSSRFDDVETRATEAAVAGSRRAGFLSSLLRDVRLTLRSRQRRAYLAAAAATLAVAVGANLVVFTIVNALWLRPLPFPDADRLVAIVGLPFISLDAPVLRPFEAVAAQVITSDRTEGLRPQFELDGVARSLETVGVTPGYFQLFGLTIRGRDFSPDDDLAGAEPVVIISDRLWAREFGRRADVIGTIAAATPVPVRIIGIAPPGFEGAQRGNRTDVWVPSRLVPRLVSRPVQTNVILEGNTFTAGSDVFLPLQAFARLRPGDTASSFTASRLLDAGVDSRALESLAIVPLKDVFGSPESRTMVVREGNIFGVVSGLAMLVLLGGCATLTALVLVHHERRRRDQAVKVALGASRAHLTCELAIELGLIAVVGMTGAVLAADWILAAMPSLTLPGGVNLGRLDLSVDGRVLAVAAATSVLTLMAAAWLPIGRFARARLAGELAGGPATTAASSQRIRQTLLALHVSATVVVLVSAGLFVRTVAHGFRDAPGFDVARTAFITVLANTAPRGGQSMDAWVTATTERTSRVKAALRALPGIDDVATGRPPIVGSTNASSLAPRTVETHGERHELVVGEVHGTPELLRTLGLPILAGRELTEPDVTTTPTPAVVTASLAQRLWPGGESLGEAFSVAGDGRGGGRYHVVGIARDFVYGSLAFPVTDVIVTARPEGAGNEVFLIVRAASIETLVEPMRQAVSAVVPEATLVRVETGRDIITRELGRQRLGAWFFSGFGLVALFLGVGGVFGLVAYLAESRKREFGVRAALGATPSDLLWHGMLAAIVPVAIGLVVGLFAAAAVARLFTSLLVGSSPIDPLTYAAIATTILSATALAALVAARRLRRIAPGDALRAN